MTKFTFQEQSRTFLSIVDFYPLKPYLVLWAWELRHKIPDTLASNLNSRHHVWTIFQQMLSFNNEVEI